MRFIKTNIRSLLWKVFQEVCVLTRRNQRRQGFFFPSWLPGYWYRNQFCRVIAKNLSSFGKSLVVHRSPSRRRQIMWCACLKQNRGKRQLCPEVLWSVIFVSYSLSFQFARESYVITFPDQDFFLLKPFKAMRRSSEKLLLCFFKSSSDVRLGLVPCNVFRFR